ncbi:ARM repeat-containing protein [Pleurostoma richardsiae]|uniref:ARM repeat-containing protein n=1 Tax=Pleurostoma richardsiae TaxID=41990 RepID=A0AA38VHE6_9PEZI|nr:ARM repeat-containing protein [Pleurostoma richardsiae]
MDELRFRSQQSPRTEAPMNSLVSPPRNGTRLPQPVPSHDLRSTLPRRFTTDSGRVPTLSSLTTQRGPEPQDFAANQAYQRVQLLEKKRMEYEKLREQKRRFEAEMAKLDLQQRREEFELAQMQEDLGRLSGHQSEPTTPPEYRETSSGFPTMFSRPNRYSTSSLTSPPGLFNRPSRSGSQLASPQSGIMQQSRFAFDDQLPSRSVPASRRNSDEDEKEEAVRQDPTSHRSTNALNRYSMPVTKSRSGFYDLGLDGTNTTRFLFGDDDSAGDNKLFAQANDENFPTLIRANDYPNMSSAPDQEVTSASNGWGNIHRHRTQQSLSTISSAQLTGSASLTSGQPSSATDVSSISARPASIRHSLEMNSVDVKYFDNASDASASSNHVLATPPKLQTSYSANDVPTVKNVSAANIMTSTSTTNHAAQQHFHNHNASLGRIPAGAMPKSHGREMSGDNAVSSREPVGYQSINSTLHANAAPFGPVAPQAQNQGSSGSSVNSQPPHMSQYNGYYGNPGYAASNAGSSNYNVPLLAMTMQGMSLNGGSMYSPQNYTGYGAVYAPPAQSRDSQARVMQSRRQVDSEAMSRYNNLPLESVGGTIYELCKDQHGCRYLQKQLENRVPDQVHMIWLETNQHVVELMTDPFGNYLCQKLLEYCNDEERTVLVQNAAQDMVRIALNQHGTRALQKMIEYVTTPEQVQLVTEALRYRVVDLIQDLNGNHVIQKCLNKLSSQDAQFVFDAVGNHCVEVGTHRHGCCVLQRCIDHASGDQKVWLIGKITEHAVALVQDPFGNYVVQYIIDLNEPTFTEPVVAMFQGRIGELSRHKFSSNVIEKCLRCALDGSKDLIVDELLVPGEMERLLRDSFANYVIQTALEYATPQKKHLLVEVIRPILPAYRSTPYGRRIQSKIQAYDANNSGRSSGQITPSDTSQGQIPLHPSRGRNMSNASSAVGPAGYANGVNGINGMHNRGSQAGTFAGSNTMTVPPPQPPRAPQYAPLQFARSSAAPAASVAPASADGEQHFF